MLKRQKTANMALRNVLSQFFMVKFFVLLSIFAEFSPRDQSCGGSVHSGLHRVPSRSERKVAQGSGGIWC